MNILWRASKHAAGWLLASMLIGNINWQLVWEPQYFQNVADKFSSCCASNLLKNGRAVICNVFRFTVQTSIAYLRQTHWLVVNHKRLRFAWRVPGLGHCVSSNVSYWVVGELFRESNFFITINYDLNVFTFFLSLALLWTFLPPSIPHQHLAVLTFQMNCTKRRCECVASTKTYQLTNDITSAACVIFCNTGVTV